MFSHAHDFRITNSTFNYVDSQDAVTTVLHHHVASGAMLDSSDRFPPGKCHPGTREGMKKKINDWIHDPLPTDNVAWLYGAAGSGKSALAQSIAETLRQLYPERYGGSFFFARGSTDRRGGHTLFATLAYQLALQIPPMRTAINGVLTHDPILPMKSMDHQLEQLIVGPARMCAKEWPLHTPTIFIDGLDECGDGEEGVDTQCAILNLISDAVLKHQLPIRFFIASRPEYWIRDVFEIGAMKSLAFRISLRDDFDADRDMVKYLQHGFEEIRVKNMRLMRSVKTPWPPRRIIDHIVEQASGQYIYASTVLKFVGKASRYCDPQEQLRILTTPGPHRASAFSDLDRLYATVLSAYPRPQSLIRVLGGLLANVGLCTIRVCLGVEENEITLVLDALSSLIDISEPDLEEDFVFLMEPIFGSPLEENQVSFCHLSFREFLEDETRSGQFFVDTRMYQECIGRKVLGIIEDNLQGRYETEPHVINKLGLTSFNRMMQNIDIITASGDDTLLTLLSDVLRKIQEFLPIGHIQYPACLMRDMEGLNRTMSSILYRGERPTRRLTSIASELAKTAELTIESARNILCDSDGFELTPTLVRIDMAQHNSDTGRLNSHSLFNDKSESIDDTLTSLRMHRHIIDPKSFLHSGEWFRDLKMFGLTMVSSIQSHRDNKHGWLSRNQWINAYVRVLYQNLKALIEDQVDDLDQSHTRVGMIQALLSSRKFDDLIFGVTSEEEFCRSHKIRIFNLLANSSEVLVGFHSRIADFEYMVQALLNWLHSETTNPVEEQYIRKHANLPQLIHKTMRELFERFFAPENLVSSPFYLYEHNRNGAIEFLPPLENTAEPIVVEYVTIPDRGPKEYTFELHHEVYQQFFGGIPTKESIVYPSAVIYPRLAAFALQAVAKYQASCIDMPMPRERHGRIKGPHSYIVWQTSEENSYVFQCLSYTLPTSENLSSLRALRYLHAKYPEYQMRLPIGFCDSLLSVLKKFKQSDLSTRELEYFKQWLGTLQAISETDFDQGAPTGRYWNSHSDSPNPSCDGSWAE